MSDLKTEDLNILWKDRKRILLFGLPWTFTKYKLMTKKLVIEQGLFSTVENEILLYRITDMSYKRTLFQKLFRMGTITVYAQDKTNPTTIIKNIKHSREFKDALSEWVENDRIRMKMRQSELVGAGHPDHDFHDFHDSGDFV